ncbi:hypothetical protein ACIRPX_45660 [Streptomyces sp. NPDC101225]|uniref:hypothetical protein n=1 Tax=Streptomyces sp. NPDC101225 TaxID=3366135 RepID=UPI003817606C
MPRPRTAVNRTVLGTAGLGLLVAGTWLAATDAAVAARLPSWWPAPAAGSALLDRGELTRLRGESWWTPSVLAVATALTVLLTWWALAQLRSGPRRRLAVASPGGTVRPRALAEALSCRAASVPGVARCRARILPRAGDRLEVGLRIWLEADTPPAAVLPALQALTEEAGRTVAPRTARVRIRLSTASHRTPYVR